MLLVIVGVLAFLAPGYVVTQIEDSGWRPRWPRWLDLPAIYVGACLWFGLVAAGLYFVL